MRTITVLLGIIGFILGMFMVLLEFGGKAASTVFGFASLPSHSIALLTLVISVIGLVGAVLVAMQQRMGAWISMLAAVAGIFTASILWEAAGSFFFIVAIIGFGNRRVTVRK